MVCAKVGVRNHEAKWKVKKEGNVDEGEGLRARERWRGKGKEGGESLDKGLEEEGEYGEKRRYKWKNEQLKEGEGKRLKSVKKGGRCKRRELRQE